jgi:pimeloyl-ACP methyl ester carboxylesterase
MVFADMPSVPGVRHEMIETPRLRMHVAMAGESGPPLVLLHGWPQHWFEWRHVMPPLAERYRVYAPDLRGLGWTDAPRSGYEKEELTADVLALLQTLGLDSVFLIGHDWGGFVGFLMCLRAPERVRRFMALSIIHPWPRPSGAGALNTWRLWYQWVLATPGLGPWALQRGPGFMLRLIRMWSPNGIWSDEELEAFADRLAQEDRALASAQYYRTFQTREFLPITTGRYRDQRLATPTLLLSGTDDGVVRPELLGGFERHADDMRLELIPGVGHFIADEKPDLVVERALQHFEA